MFTRVVVPTPTTDVPASDPVNEPIPKGGLSFRSYTSGCPFIRLCLILESYSFIYINPHHQNLTITLASKPYFSFSIKIKLVLR